MSSLYENVIKSLKDNKQKRLKGELIAIPWQGLPKLNRVLPGIVKENYAIISANQKVGKTQLADYLYLYQPIDWLFNNRDSKLDLDIMYFSLELSKEAKMRQAISYRLFTRYGVVISPQDLRSIFDSYILEDDIEALIDAEREWFEFFLSKVTFFDNIRNPFGIYSAVKNKMESNGEYIYKDIPWVENGVTVQKKIRDYYVPNNPDLITEVVVDHYRLMTPEREDDGNLYKAIGRFSSRYALEMRDLWKCQVVGVVQQTPTSESQQYTMLGGTVLDKVKPTPDGLGDNKSVAQDVNLMISLFHPARYNQKNYNGIDLERMDDSYRELSINLNRDGINNAHLNLYFQGASNYFEEMPSDHFKLENFYKRIEKLKGKTKWRD